MNLKTGVTRKRSVSNFSKNEHLPSDMDMHVCTSGSKKYSVFEKFGTLCFRVTLVLRFALLPYYWLYIRLQKWIWNTLFFCKNVVPYATLVTSDNENCNKIRSFIMSSTNVMHCTYKVIVLCIFWKHKPVQ